MSTPSPPLPADREWVSFEDPGESRTWVFDVTFLASGWRCIFAQGCQGVLTGPAPELVQGCCSYGAHLTDDDDVARVEAAAASLTDEQWQFARQGRRRGVVKATPAGERVTRLVEDACIFLNRPGFGAGPGCALHQAALGRGQPPLALKPEVCWQLPLRREDADPVDGHVTSTVTEWGRRHWGGGGEEFHWWCTEAPEAFDGEPVYRSMAAELRAMVGAEVYAGLAAYLDRRRGEGGEGGRGRLEPSGDGSVPLPHPTVRHTVRGHTVRPTVRGHTVRPTVPGHTVGGHTVGGHTVPGQGVRGRRQSSS